MKCLSHSFFISVADTIEVWWSILIALSILGTDGHFPYLYQLLVLLRCDGPFFIILSILGTDSHIPYLFQLLALLRCDGPF
jgi:hypothetical protein